jgi:hypothetical protein
LIWAGADQTAPREVNALLVAHKKKPAVTPAFVIAVLRAI